MNPGDRATVKGDRPQCGVDDGRGDYLNCPLTRDEYARFYDALVHAESATVHDFDHERFFEGCLPIEVMAHRGVDTLRFGPMKPVGLLDPRTGREPYAAVQLRQDNLAGDHYSLVGFQTQIKWGDQARVLRLIPGLENAEFVRFGMVHRNTYVNGPTVLSETWQVRRRPTLFFAGQMSGVEGYVESASSGLLAGLNAAALVNGQPTSAPPRTTAIGALAYYVSHADPAHYEPSNITFGIMEPLARAPRGKMERKLAMSDRALTDLDAMDGVAAAADGARGSVIDHLESFLQYLRLNRNLSPHTVRAYESDLTQFLETVASRAGVRRRDLEPAALDRATIRGFLADAHAHGQSRATAARKLAAVRTFLRYLRREGVIDDDPAALIATPKRDVRMPAHLSEQEMIALLAAPAGDQPLGRRDHAILELFYASGLRLSELAGLDIDDVNLSAKMVRVLGKGGKQRLVPFNTSTASAIRAYLTGQSGADARERSRRDRTAADADPPTTTRCLSTIAAGASASAASTGSCGAMSPRAARGSASARTPCGIPSPRTCCSAAPTCGRSRNCSAMRASAPRSATRMSTPRSCSRCTGRVIRGRQGQERLDRQEGQEPDLPALPASPAL